MSSASLLSALTTELASCGQGPAPDALVLQLCSTLSELASLGHGESTAATPGLVPALLAACASQPRAPSIDLALAKALCELAGTSSTAGAALLASGVLPLMVSVGATPHCCPGASPLSPPAVILQAPGGLAALLSALAASPWATAPQADTTVPGSWLATAAGSQPEGLLALTGLLQEAVSSGGSLNLCAALCHAVGGTLQLPSSSAAAALVLPQLLKCLPSCPHLMFYLSSSAFSMADWEEAGQAARLEAAPHLLALLHCAKDQHHLLAVVGSELLLAWPLVQGQLAQLLQEHAGASPTPEGPVLARLLGLVKSTALLVPHLSAEARAAASTALGAHLVAALPTLPFAYQALQSLSCPALHPALVAAAEAALAAGSVPTLAKLLSPLLVVRPHPQLQLGAREAAMLTAALRASSASQEACAMQVAGAVGMAATLAPSLLHEEGFFAALSEALRACLACSKQPLQAGVTFESLQLCWSVLVHNLDASIEAGVPGAAEGGAAAAVVSQALGECLGASWQAHVWSSKSSQQHLLHCLARQWTGAEALARRCAQLLRWHEDWLVPGYDSAARLLPELLKGQQAEQAFVGAGGVQALLAMLRDSAPRLESNEFARQQDRQMALQAAAVALHWLRAHLTGGEVTEALCSVLRESTTLHHLPALALTLFALRPAGQQAVEAGRAAVVAVQRCMQWVEEIGRSKDDDYGAVAVARACGGLVQDTLDFAARAGVIAQVFDEGAVGALGSASLVWGGAPRPLVAALVQTLEGAGVEAVQAVAAALCRAVQGGEEGGLAAALRVAQNGRSRLLEELRLAGLEQAALGVLQRGQSVAAQGLLEELGKEGV